MTRPEDAQIDGVVDRLTPSGVVGWAFARDDSAPLRVELRVNGDPVAQALCDAPRPVLLEAGRHPTGRCGFELRFPSTLALRPGDRIHVRVLDRVGELRKSQHTVVLASDGSLVFEVLPDRLKDAEGEWDEVEIPRFPRLLPRRSWVIFRNTLRALFLREVGQRFGASRFGYPWAVAQPLLILLILVQVRTLLVPGDSELYGVSGAFFFLIGVVPYFLFQNAYNQAMGAIRSGRGVYNYRAVRPFDLVLVRCGIEGALMLLVMLVLMLGFWWFGIESDAQDPLGMLGACLLLFGMALGFGLIADISITRAEDSSRIFSLIERPLFFVSGVFFVVEDVPQPLRDWLLWNPILHAIDLARGAMLSQYDSPCSWTYAALWTLGLLLVALGQYRRYLYRLLTT